MNINRIEKGLDMTLSTILKLSLTLELKPQELLKSKVKFQYSDIDQLVSQNKGSKMNYSKISDRDSKKKMSQSKPANPTVKQNGNLRFKNFRDYLWFHEKIEFLQIVNSHKNSRNLVISHETS